MLIQAISSHDVRVVSSGPRTNDDRADVRRGPDALPNSQQKQRAIPVDGKYGYTRINKLLEGYTFNAGSIVFKTEQRQLFTTRTLAMCRRFFFFFYETIVYAVKTRFPTNLLP